MERVRALIIPALRPIETQDCSRTYNHTLIPHHIATYIIHPEIADALIDARARTIRLNRRTLPTVAACAAHASPPIVHTSRTTTTAPSATSVGRF